MMIYGFRITNALILCLLRFLYNAKSKTYHHKNRKLNHSIDFLLNVNNLLLQILLIDKAKKRREKNESSRR